MNYDCKYLLCWLIPCLLIGLVGIFIMVNYCYKMNSKFIENGFHMEQKIGDYGVIWKK
jgi:hypothetical protein